MNLKSFIHLIRYDNLLIIALTMLATRYGMIEGLLSKYHPGVHLLLSHGQFVLLVISTLLIAAAGYIINDYFDVKTDRINKPQRVYIDKGIKRRVAIIIHTCFNVIGVLLAFYVAYTCHNLILSLISVSASVLLWFYSTHFKRQLITGNMVVSLLSALVPLQVLWFDMWPLVVTLHYSYTDFLFLYMAVICFAVFAFLLSMMREIVKDMEDYKGDAETGCRTMPIAWGIKASKAVVAGLVSNTLLLLIFIFYKLLKIDGTILSAYLFVCVFIPLLFLLKNLYHAQSSADFHRLSKSIKFIMLTGVLSSLIIYIICHENTF